MRNANQSIFSQIQGPNVERSRVYRPSTLKTTLNPDYLYPIYVDKVLPGDTHTVTVHNLVRMSNPLKSVPMDNIYLDMFAFFVPHRTVFDKFQAMMGEQDDPDDTTDYTYPKLNTYEGYTISEGESYLNEFPTGSLFDYLGLPTKVEFPHASLSDNFINALSARGYNRIFHYWFRDQNLMDKGYLVTGVGPDDLGTITPVGGTDDNIEDATTNYRLRKRCKNRDYFTSCLLTPQKGPDVTIPIGDTAPVYGSGYGLPWSEGSQSKSLTEFPGSGPAEIALAAATNGAGYALGAYLGGAVADTTHFTGYVSGVAPKSLIDPAHPEYSGLVADLEQATQTSINDFRLLFAKQRYFERKARGGSRYKEIIKSFFGVSVPDFRLQWPELLGISSQKIQTSEIAQTSGTGASGTSTPLGILASQAISANTKTLFSKAFVEHGNIIILANIRCDLTYWQGIDRQFTDSTVFDEFWPQFGHIGEQAILNREIQYTGTSVYDDAVFGYQQAWAWLKYKNNKITGQMRPNATINFKQWHLAQELNAPALDQTFIESGVPIERVSSSTAADYFLADFLFDTKSIRPVPFNTDPGLLDHF